MLVCMTDITYGSNLMIVVDDCLATRILIYFVCLGANVFASIRTIKIMAESQLGRRHHT